MKAFKGFNKGLQCRGFQYQVGGSYAEEAADLCSAGFHACESPLDVFSYYSPGQGSRYCEVELIDPSDQKGDDSKRVARKIKIGAEIGVPGLVKAHIDYVKTHTTTEHTDPERATAGSYGAATAGSYGAATAGSYGAATAGDCGAATAGSYGAATAGSYGAATAGNRGAATAGKSGAATSRGSSAVGAEGIACARGNKVKVKGGLGAVLVLVEEKTDSYALDDWKVVIVDGETIKADTWYGLRDGEVIEIEETENKEAK